MHVRMTVASHPTKSDYAEQWRLDCGVCKRMAGFEENQSEQWNAAMVAEE